MLVRPPSSFLAVAVLALLGGAGCSPGSGAPRPVAPGAPAAAPSATLSAPAAAGDPTLADSWLVILGSKRDPNEVIPALGVLAQHPEVATHPRTLLSSRFKNLMPCYTVTVADALKDKDAALALSAKLKSLGADNYVKNAGAWVGASGALDAWCAEDAGATGGAAQILVQAGGEVWLPVPDAPEGVAGRLLTGRPVAMNREFDAWRQPASSNTLGATGPGQVWRAVDAASGRTATCTTVELAGLTLGTPHFGVLQNGTPTAPACGEAKVYARMSCPGLTDTGTWIARREATGLLGYSPAGAGSAALLAAAKGELTQGTDWEVDPAPVEGDEPVTRDAAVALWRGPAGTVAVVTGTRAAGGVCGGEETLWVAVYAAGGDTLGRVIVPFATASFAEVKGLVDVEGDGVPEVVLGAFPDRTTVLGADGGTRAESDIAYCDCPC